MCGRFTITHPKKVLAALFAATPGKTLSGGPPIITARSDTVAQKPAIRDHRCIPPASGFYQRSPGPNATRLPCHITRRNGQPLAFAALWQSQGDIDTVALVTTDAGPGMAGMTGRGGRWGRRPDVAINDHAASPPR